MASYDPYSKRIRLNAIEIARSDSAGTDGNYTVISPDEKAMKLAKKALEKMGFEVDWGW